MGEIFAVRVNTADGSVVDLLLFAERAHAERYAVQLQSVLGFDTVAVIAKLVIGCLAA